MANKYPGYCADCRCQVPAGHGELKKDGSKWTVRCGGNGRTAQAKKDVAAAGKTGTILNSPGRAALQGRSRNDFSLGEESAISRCFALDYKPGAEDLGQVMLAKRGDEKGQYIICIGL